MTERQESSKDVYSKAAEPAAAPNVESGLTDSGQTDAVPPTTGDQQSSGHWRWLSLLLLPILTLLSVPLIYLAFNGLLPGGTLPSLSVGTADKGGSTSVTIGYRALVPRRLTVEIELDPAPFRSPFWLTRAAALIRAETLVRFARSDLTILNQRDPIAEALRAAGASGYGSNDETAALWPSEATQAKEGSQLRLGDVVLSGQVGQATLYNAIVYAPDRGFADLGSWPEELLAWQDSGRSRRLALLGSGQQQQPQQARQETQSSSQQQQQQQQGRRQPTGQAVPLYATHPDIVMAAAQVALLRADAAGRSSIAFVGGLNDHEANASGAALPLPAELWTLAVLRALQAAGPVLTTLERVQLEPFDAKQDGLDLAAAETYYGDLLLGLAPQGIVEAYRRAARQTLAISLPWPRRREFLEASWISAPTTEQPALSAEQLNPILSTTSRQSFLPMGAALGFFVFMIAFQLRRHAPVTLDASAGMVAGTMISAALAYVLFLSSLATKDWALVSPAAESDLLEGGLYLGYACLLTAAFGGLAGYVTYRFARSQDPRLDATKDDASKTSQVRAYLYSDKPVADLAEDRLNFAPLVRALVSFLDNRGTKPPVVLAVNGPWGSGKSSLMSMLATELKETGRFHIAWFNAWQYQNQEQILAAFLKSIAGELSKTWGPWLSLRLAWARFKDANFSELFLLLLPVFLIVLALAVPTILQQLPAAKADDSPVASLAGSLELLFYVLGGGGLLAQARKVLPFQFSTKWLFAGSDLSGKLGFLDEFQREFRLYREAAGRDKFLIIVDDLDRCNPDAVVEVLKTVNLIVNGDNGPGKTFFILGFDERYIVQSVEEEFKDFAVLDKRGTGSFGRDYLKKIVTVSLSVPVPHEDRLKELAEVLGDGAAPDKRPKAEKPTRIKALGAWFAQQLDLLRRPLPLVLLIFFLVGALLWLGQDGEESQTPIVQTQGQTEAGLSPSNSKRFFTSEARLTQLPTTDRGAQTSFGGLLRHLDLLGLALALAAALGFAAAVRRQQVALPEPLDTREFAEALEAIGDHLPKNPRDLVRLVNRMRVDYLVQAPQRDPSAPPSASEPDDPPAQDEALIGQELSAEESVAMTLLCMSHRELLDPAKLENWLRPALQEKEPHKALAALAQEEGERGTWMRDLKALYESVAPAANVLTDGRKLARHISVQGYFAPPAEVEVESSKDPDETPPQSPQAGNGQEAAD